jgi:hypothetical protein
MRDINLESGLIGGDCKFTGRRGRRNLRTFKFLAALMVLFPVGLAAQTTSSTAVSSSQGSAYGTGLNNTLQFAGESKPANLVSLGIGAAGFYDDNVLATNSDRVGDEALSLRPHFGVSTQTENLSFNFNYTPFFLLYRQFSQFDQFNQSANLNLAFRLSPRFTLGLSDTFGFRYGDYPSFYGADIPSGPISPTELNQLITPFTTRTLSNMTGVNLTFVKSQRTSFTFSGGYNLSRYGNSSGESGSLYDFKGEYGSVKYDYRATEHTSLGLNVVHADSIYEAGPGLYQRAQTESLFFFVSSRLSPTLSVSANGGPQYVHSPGQSSVEDGLQEGVYGSGGGSITKEARKTALTASFQRSVSDAGGLYATVINNTAMFGARRRLVGLWQTGLRGGVGQVHDLVSQQGADYKTDYLQIGIDFSRPIRNRSDFHISYNTMHEMYQGALPGFNGFDRNQVTVGVDFQLKQIPLGQ